MRQREYDYAPHEPIMVCDRCQEPSEVCDCPWCCHCGENEEGLVVVKIKCPVSKCVDVDDGVCVSCKNVHDREHNL